MHISLFISEGVSYKISNYLSNLHGKKNTMIYSFIISAFSFFSFYLFKNDSIFTLVFIFTAKFGAAVVLNISSMYTNESFPAKIRGRSTAICSFVGKFGGILAPMLVETTKNTALISAFACIIAALILIPLRSKNEEEVQIELIDTEKMQELDNLRGDFIGDVHKSSKSNRIYSDDLS